MRGVPNKWCCKCEEFKPLEAFHRSRSRSDGRHTVCKACRVGCNARTMRAAHLMRKYGITVEQYDTMLEAQDGLCAICRKPEKAVSRGKLLPLAVDHCHVTGRIRGLLCNLCNTALGKFGDDPLLLRRAADYVSK